MKKIIVCLVLLVITNSVFSQPGKTSPPLTKKDYLQKSKNQKTAAWLFTGGGIVLTGIGLSEPNDNSGQSDDSRKTVLIVTGLASLSIGITLFILATENKNKAAALSFRMEKAPLVQQGNFVYHSYPALSFHLNL